MESSTSLQVHHSVPVLQGDEPRRNAGRPRKDFQLITTLFDSLDEFRTALKDAIDTASQAPAPERVSCAFTLSLVTVLECTFPTMNASAVHRDYIGNGGGANSQRSVYDLCNIIDPKERLAWQRAAAKGIQKSIEDLDGFRYCFNNNWTSKDDDGCRFSYTCLDSLENSDRLVNGFKRTTPARRRPEAGTRGVRKPTYDCRGQISVKFSGVRQLVEVVYKHTALHKTVAERAPPPRRSQTRRKQSAGTPSESAEQAFPEQDNAYAQVFDDDDSFRITPTAETPEASRTPPSSLTLALDGMTKGSARINKDAAEVASVKKRRKRAPKDSSATEQGTSRTTISKTGGGKTRARFSTADAEDQPLSLADLLRQQTAKAAPSAGVNHLSIMKSTGSVLTPGLLPLPYETIPIMPFYQPPVMAPPSMTPPSMAPSFMAAPPTPKPWAISQTLGGHYQPSNINRQEFAQPRAPSPDPWFPPR